MKRLGVIFLLIIGMLGVVFLYVRSGDRPPREKKLIENFYAHRTAYEHLRDMLQADEGLLRVASWGLETTKSMGPVAPSEAGFPIDRYDKYLELLRETGGIGAFRARGEHPESVSIGVWASGWAGHSEHVQICWREHEPANQVANLDDYYLTPKPHQSVFRHIEGNWYLWADW
jgi:hypothetical protein